MSDGQDRRAANHGFLTVSAGESECQENRTRGLAGGQAAMLSTCKTNDLGRYLLDLRQVELWQPACFFLMQRFSAMTKTLFRSTRVARGRDGPCVAARDSSPCTGQQGAGPERAVERAAPAPAPSGGSGGGNSGGAAGGGGARAGGGSGEATPAAARPVAVARARAALMEAAGTRAAVVAAPRARAAARAGMVARAAARARPAPSVRVPADRVRPAAAAPEAPVVATGASSVPAARTRQRRRRDWYGKSGQTSERRQRGNRCAGLRASARGAAGRRDGGAALVGAPQG